MMRARQLEEVREARKAEMERRAESKKAGLEGRKEEIKQSKNKKRRRGDAMDEEAKTDQPVVIKKFKSAKRVSFG